MPRSGFNAIIFPMLMWLPVTFALWFFCGPLLAVLIALVLDLALPLLTAERIIRVESAGEIIHAVVVLEAGLYKGLEVPAGQTAELMIQSRPMVFSYGMPVFLALAFAADARCDISRNLLAGCIAVLLAVAAFGAGMDLVKTVFLSLPTDIVRTNLSGMQENFIALGYQFGVLILPLVMPMLLGCWLCAAWFRSVLRKPTTPL